MRSSTDTAASSFPAHIKEDEEAHVVDEDEDEDEEAHVDEGEVEEAHVDES